MKKIVSLFSLCLFLLGCTNASDQRSPTVYNHQNTYGAALNNSPRHPHAGQWAVAAIGTPFYLAFKTAVCGATLVVAAPAAAALAIADSPYGMGMDELGDGVASNCGPPYVLSPS